MNSEQHIKVLQDQLLLKISETFYRDWVFQQDGAPAHTAERTKRFLEAQRVKVLDWPSKSPDLNPIENLWSTLKHAVYSRNPRDIDEMKQYISEEIAIFDKKSIHNLIDSMRKRVQMVIEKEGDVIDY